MRQTSLEPSLFFIGLGLRTPITVPVSVFHRSVWTDPNRKRDTFTSRLWRSFSFQMLKVFPYKKYKHVHEYTIFNMQNIRCQKWWSLTLFLLCGVILFIITAKVTQSLSSKLSLASRSDNWESLISLRLAIFCSMSMEDRRGFLQGNITHCVFLNSKRN